MNNHLTFFCFLTVDLRPDIISLIYHVRWCYLFGCSK